MKPDADTFAALACVLPIDSNAKKRKHKSRVILRKAMMESLEERLALTINYAIAPNTTLDIYPLSAIIPAAPAGMDRMEVLLTTIPGVSHGHIYRVTNTESYIWGSGAPNVFTVGAGNDRITSGEGFRYVNDGTGDGTSESIPVKFRDGTGFNFKNDTIVISINSNLHPPTITTQPNTFIQIPPGGKATMSVVGSGSPAPTYQWYQGIAPDASHPIAGATAASYTTPSLTPIQQYYYFCRVTNSGGSVDTLTVTVQTAIPTTVTTFDTALAYSPNDQFTSMYATVTPGTLNVGNVTYTVLGVGVPATSATIVNGQAAPTSFTVPDGTIVGTYPLEAHYAAPAGTAESFDHKTFTIVRADTTTTAANKIAVASGSDQSVSLSASVTNLTGTIAQGTITFTLLDGANVIGSPVTSATVAGGAASVNYTLPANTRAGAYTVKAVYNPSSNYNGSSDSTHTLTESPKITSSTAALAANATSLTINGFGFDATTLANNVVTFPAGVTGTVTAATATQLTLSNLAGLVAGNLSVSVAVRNVASAPAQVASVIPVITSSTAATGPLSTSLTINGFGFSSTAANNVVTLSGGATGTVTAASRTQMTISSVAGLKVGALTASVKTNGQSSGAAVQIATVIPVLTTSAASLDASATTMTIAGFGFDTTAANNSVTFSGGATGTVTAATSTQLTISNLTGLVGGSLTASVTTDSTSSGAAVQVATVVPVVTPNSAVQPVTTTTVTINGFGFDPTAAKNTVTFNNGITGTVSAATKTTLSITNLTNLVSGTLAASVTVNGVSSASLRVVANITPIVTSSSILINPKTTTLIINGQGFSKTFSDNSIKFSPAAAGKVTASSPTQLTYTFSAPLTAGPLTAVVTTNLVDSGTPVQVAIVDATPPTASNGILNLNSPSFGTISIQMSEAISLPLLQSHLSIDAVGGPTLKYTPISVVQDAVTHIATFKFASVFANHNYHATLTAAGLTDLAGNPMAADYGFNFYFLNGDANRDRSVGFADLVAVAQHYGQSNVTYSTGDLNGDNTVGFADLVAVAQNYGASTPLPAPAVSEAPAPAMSALPDSILKDHAQSKSIFSIVPVSKPNTTKVKRLR